LRINLKKFDFSDQMQDLEAKYCPLNFHVKTDPAENNLCVSDSQMCEFNCMNDSLQGPVNINFIRSPNDLCNQASEQQICIRPFTCEKNVCDDQKQACRTKPNTNMSCNDPCKKRRYVQPARVANFKPIRIYERPTIPMASDTVYNKSFYCVDSRTAAMCRLPPAKILTNLTMPVGRFEDQTITKISFQPFCVIERTKPIYPRKRSMIVKGPMQALTTQRHDFVAKYTRPVMKIYPRNHLKNLCGNFEKCTIQKLSFLPPCAITKPKSFKPIRIYQKPECKLIRVQFAFLKFLIFFYFFSANGVSYNSKVEFHTSLPAKTRRSSVGKKRRVSTTNHQI
jgi:hypothetical protein